MKSREAGKIGSLLFFQAPIIPGIFFLELG